MNVCNHILIHAVLTHVKMLILDLKRSLDVVFNNFSIDVKEIEH